MATSRKIIGSIIKFNREKSNMTLQELGDRIGKDRQYVWRIENGKVNTTFDTLDEIIRALKNKHTDYFNQSNITHSK